MAEHVSESFRAFDDVIEAMNGIVEGMSGTVTDAAETMQFLVNEIIDINPTDCRALKELLTERLPVMKAEMETLRDGLALLKARQVDITESAQGALDLARPPSDASAQDALDLASPPSDDELSI
jgi:uncharacterized coiled-coil protein SlyX